MGGFTAPGSGARVWQRADSSDALNRRSTTLTFPTCPSLNRGSSVLSHHHAFGAFGASFATRTSQRKGLTFIIMHLVHLVLFP
jgi:hypothetical protein